MLEYDLTDGGVTMDDEEESLLAAIENAKKLYKLASGNLAVAQDRLLKFRKRKLEQQAEAAGWTSGIKVRGVPKAEDRVPKKLRDSFRERKSRGQNTPKMGVYVGCKVGVGGEPVPDIRIFYGNGRPLPAYRFTEMYDWHRVLDVPKED
jgi:hypothetical protein